MGIGECVQQSFLKAVSQGVDVGSILGRHYQAADLPGPTRQRKIIRWKLRQELFRQRQSVAQRNDSNRADSLIHQIKRNDDAARVSFLFELLKASSCSGMH